MSTYIFKKVWLICCILSGSLNLFSQDVFSLQSCLSYALEYNHSLKKMQYDKEKAVHAYKEVMGALLPQVNGTANLNDNLKKAKFIMPNFINSMLPPDAQDPNADIYHDH